MKKSSISLALLVIAAIILFPSCLVNAEEEDATLRISITNERSRTIAPEESDLKIAKYKFTLTASSIRNGTDESITESFEKERNDSGQYTLSGLKPGVYSITVEAYTNGGSKVSSATVGSQTITRGANTISVTLTTLSGSQNVTITYTWDKSTYGNTTFALTITDENGQAVNVGESEINTATAGKAVVTKNLSAGSYIFSAALKSKGSYIYSMIGHTEVIRVGSSGTLTKTVAFTDTAQSNTITVSENIGITPMSGSIAIPSSSSGGVTATFTVNESSLPKGITKKGLKIIWYNEDFKLGESTTGDDGTTQLKFYPYEGTTRVTAVIKCDGRPGAMGAVSASCTYPSK